MSGEALKSDSLSEVENGYDISETLERVYAMRNKDEAYDLAHELDEAGLGANAKIAGAFRERSRLLESRDGIIGRIGQISSFDELQEKRQAIEELVADDNILLNENDIERIRVAFNKIEEKLQQDGNGLSDGNKVDDEPKLDAQDDVSDKTGGGKEAVGNSREPLDVKFAEAIKDLESHRKTIDDILAESRAAVKQAGEDLKKKDEDLRKDVAAPAGDQKQDASETSKEWLVRMHEENEKWLEGIHSEAEKLIAEIEEETRRFLADMESEGKKFLGEIDSEYGKGVTGRDINSGRDKNSSARAETDKKDIKDMTNRIHQAVMGADDVGAQGMKDTSGGQSAPERAKMHVEPILVEGDNTLKGAVDLLADYFAPAVDEKDKDLSRGARITEFFDRRGKSEQPKASAEVIAGVDDNTLKGAVDILADYFAPAVDEKDKDLSRGARITEFFNNDVQVGENDAANSDVGSDDGDVDKKEKGIIPEGAEVSSKTPFWFKFHFDRTMMPKEKNGDGLTMEKAIRTFSRKEFLGVSVETVVTGFQQFLTEQNGGQYDENGKIIRGSDGFFSNDERIPKMRRLIKERYEELGLDEMGKEKPEGERPKKKVGFSLRKAFIKSLNRR